MARERLYATNAERQAAYRARLTRRQQDAADSRLVARVAELEQQLAAARQQADTAHQRAAAAEGQVGALKLTVAALQHRLERPDPTIEGKPPAGPDRAARRAAQNHGRRGRR